MEMLRGPTKPTKMDYFNMKTADKPAADKKKKKNSLNILCFKSFLKMQPPVREKANTWHLKNVRILLT